MESWMIVAVTAGVNLIVLFVGLGVLWGKFSKLAQDNGEKVDALRAQLVGADGLPSYITRSEYKEIRHDCMFSIGAKVDSIHARIENLAAKVERIETNLVEIVKVKSAAATQKGRIEKLDKKVEQIESKLVDVVKIQDTAAGREERLS